MTVFDLVLRGGSLIDGTGSAARTADIGVLGDRILAVGDLSAVDTTGVETVLELDGRVIAPGFIDPHGHSDGSVFVDGALASHIHQGGVISLESAVAKLTSVPAARLGLRDRGVVREGAMADLVTFDPRTAADVADYLEPARYPVGIEDVVVNGRPVVLAGAETGERPGRLLRHA